MCDALMEIPSSTPTSCTARQLVDETFLRERGFTEERLASYWVAGAAPADPMYIDGRASQTLPG